MLLRIVHTTRFNYSDRVFLEPLTIRLRPRCDCWQKLHRYRLQVDPEPKGMTESVDLEGNSITTIWSTGLCKTLTLQTESVVETLRDNPFDFILTENDALSLPIKYDPSYGNALDPYLTRDYSGEDVHDFAHGLLKEFGSNTVSFLTSLNQYIHQTFERIFRPEGDPMHPSELLQTRKGACRDLTILFMDVCRVLGLATRFTSGYFFGEEEGFEHQLHAWAEVYLPGGGWRGYDPTHGLAVADRHIALASACKPLLTAPTFGMYRGTGITSSLDFDIQIQKVASVEDSNSQAEPS